VDPSPAIVQAAQNFQPVRAGQFYFLTLQIVDRFGQVFNRVYDGGDAEDANQFRPRRASSVTPSSEFPLYEEVEDEHRFLQLPPRFLQAARLRHDTVPGSPAMPSTPVVGWLMHNHLDRTLMVYAPDGAALGALRTLYHGPDPETSWAPLPHAPYSHPDPEIDPAFEANHPHLADFLNELLSLDNGAFAALTETVNSTLEHITDPSLAEDSAPVRLIGRPLALVRTDLGIDFLGEAATDPNWQHVVQPPTPEHPEYLWAVRLGGSPDQIHMPDGLIGYFSSSTGPDQPISYETFKAVRPDTEVTHPYVVEIPRGHDLRLRARSPHQDRETHGLTLLVDPHRSVHATTDILPVHSLPLDPHHIHHALARIRASFRLHPLLAPTHTTGDATATTSLGTTEPHDLTHILRNDTSSYYQSAQHPKLADHVTVDLGAPHSIEHINLDLGLPVGGFTLPAFDLQASVDETAWETLASYDKSIKEARYTPPAPLTARYLRLHMTGEQGFRIAIRRFQATTAPAHTHLAMPHPAPWHGTWTWATPLPNSTELPDWADLPLINAGTQHQPDNPTPTAHAGYLQLQPAAEEPQDDTPQPT
ncbi:discoidin domain-containing protein, partial [Streptomyces formicae]